MTPTDPRREAFEKALDELLLGYSEAVADGANNTTDEARYHAARSAVLTLYREALEDARRVDWLDAQREQVVECGGGNDPQLIGYEWRTWGEFTSVRSAIDAAMATNAASSTTDKGRTDA